MELNDAQKQVVELCFMIVNIVESKMSDEEKLKCFKGMADGIKDSMTRKK